MNQIIEDFDVDSLRKPWEIEEHWVLRRDFIEAHKAKIPMDRLQCLAQAFVNIQTMGNQYPAALTQEVTALSEDLPCLKEFHDRKAQLEQNEDFKPPAKSSRQDQPQRDYRGNNNYNQPQRDYRQSNWNQQSNQGGRGGGGYQGGYGNPSRQDQPQREWYGANSNQPQRAYGQSNWAQQPNHNSRGSYGGGGGGGGYGGTASYGGGASYQGGYGISRPDQTQRDWRSNSNQSQQEHGQSNWNQLPNQGDRGGRGGGRGYQGGPYGRR